MMMRLMNSVLMMTPIAMVATIAINLVSSVSGQPAFIISIPTYLASTSNSTSTYLPYLLLVTVPVTASVSTSAVNFNTQYMALQ